MKTKKKVLSLILSIALLMGLLPTTAVSALAADNKNALTTTASDTLKSGDTFEASFTQLETVSEVSNYEVGIGFDTNVLEVTNIKAAKIDGSGMFGNTPVKNANECGEASTNVVSASNNADMTLPAGEKILTLTFKVKNNVTSGKTKISLTKYLVGGLEDNGYPKTLTPTNIGVKEITLNIQGSDSPQEWKIILSKIADQPYTGKAVEPEVVVKDNTGNTLSKDDYTVQYSNNIQVGEATVTVQAKKNGKTVEATGTFNIVDSYGILPVEEKINAIGKVTLDSAAAINEARAAYDALDKDAKQYVSNYDTLTTAEDALQKLLDKEDEALADVISKISAIGNVTLESEDAITAARTAYDKLSDANKAKVTNYSVLTDAEAALKELWKNDNITCYVRAESDDGTVLPLTKVTMNKHEVPSFSSYAIKNGPDDKNYVSALHILLQALTDRGMTDELATVDIASSGWITDIFGWGMDNLWCLNGIDAPVMSCNYEAKDGETYVFYQASGNWQAGYGYPGYGFFGEFGPGQYYTEHSAIETTEMTKEVGEAADFKYLYTSSMHMPNMSGACNNEDGYTTKVYVSKDGAETVTDEDYRDDIKVDKDGKFQVTFDKPGTYVVSARYYNPDGSRSASNAYCKVTVQDTYGIVALKNDIDQIGTVTLASESAINKARAAYDALPDEVKTRVSNYDTLTAAETALQSLKAQVAAVIDQINAIGDVTLNSENAINEARAAYNALSDEQKECVTNIATLTAAEQRLEKLKGDAKAVADTEAAIDAIGKVTLDSEGAIQTARAAYDGLSDDNKAKVSNYETLKNAEDTLAQLKADQATAADVDQKIEAIGKVTLDSRKAIEEARAAYDALTDVQKQQVTKLAVLTEAEDAYQELAKAEKEKAKEVEKKIDAIGKVSLDSEKAIKEARDAYDALGTDFKSEVSNYSDLQAAEKKLSDLKMDQAAEEVEKKIDAIGKVSLDSEKAIKEARDAYDALPDAAKKKVNNYKTLTDAEKQMADLKTPMKDNKKQNTKQNTKQGNSNAKNTSVKTGDTTNMVLPLCILLIAAAVAGYCMLIRRKKRS